MGANFPNSPTNGQTTTVGNTVYAYNSTTGAWEIVSSGGIGTMTTKGDLLSRSSTGLARVGVGADGRVLMADSTQTAGVAWSTSPIVCTWATKPSSPYVGQQIYDSGTNIIYVYNGSAWVCITPQSSLATNQQSYNSTSFVAITGDPSVSLYTGTKAMIWISVRQVSSTSAQYVRTGCAISGASTIAATTVKSAENYFNTGDLGNDRAASFTYMETSLTAGYNTFTLNHSASAGVTAYATQRSITVVGIP